METKLTNILRGKERMKRKKEYVCKNKVQKIDLVNKGNKKLYLPVKNKTN